MYMGCGDTEHAFLPLTLEGFELSTSRFRDFSLCDLRDIRAYYLHFTAASNYEFDGNPSSPRFT